jgi:hypothetical protein
MVSEQTESGKRLIPTFATGRTSVRWNRNDVHPDVVA